MKSHFATPILSSILALTLVVSPLQAQAPVSLDGSRDHTGAQSLQLRVLDLDGHQTPVNARTTAGFAVQVTDSAGAAVADAALAFRLPDSGPTGTFADGTHSA